MPTLSYSATRDQVEVEFSGPPTGSVLGISHDKARRNCCLDGDPIDNERRCDLRSWWNQRSFLVEDAVVIRYTVTFRRKSLSFIHIHASLNLKLKARPERSIL